MAPRYGVFDNGQPVTANDFSEVLAAVATSGVVPGWGGGFTATLLGGQAVQLSDGKLLVRGRYYYDTLPTTLQVAPPHPTLPRWDRIVARLDQAAGTVALAVLTGTPAATPSYPPLTQVPGGVWELPLWGVRLPANGPPTQLEDQRLFVGATLADHAHTGPGAGGALAASSIATGTLDLARLPAIPLAQLDRSVYRPELCLNGRFLIWQRGSGPFTQSGAYCADGWAIEATSVASISVQRADDRAAGSARAVALQYAVSVVANTVADIYQWLDPAVWYRHLNTPLTFAAAVEAGQVQSWQVFIQAFNSAGLVLDQRSAPVTATGLAVAAVTATLPSGAQPPGSPQTPINRVRVGIVWTTAGAYTGYVWAASLVPGTVAGIGPDTAYGYPHAPTREWAACLQRYRRYGAPTEAGGYQTLSPTGYAFSATQAVFPYRFEPPFGGQPTFTSGGNIVLNNGASTVPVTGFTTMSGYPGAYDLVANVANPVLIPGYATRLFANNDPNAYIAFEWNPA